MPIQEFRRTQQASSGLQDGNRSVFGEERRNRKHLAKQHHHWSIPRQYRERSPDAVKEVQGPSWCHAGLTGQKTAQTS